jgi:hypothetical protein
MATKKMMSLRVKWKKSDSSGNRMHSKLWSPSGSHEHFSGGHICRLKVRIGVGIASIAGFDGLGMNL